MNKFFLAACLSVPTLAFTAVSGPAYAQSTISGDLVGTVVDPTGAVIPGAKVTATNTATGIAASAVSGAKGEYRLSLLKPGSYSVKVTAAGFGTNENTVLVSAGAVANLESKLTTGSANTVIEVSDAAPLLQTEDAQITTTFSQEQVQALPNPGGDITYYAQTAPGVVMNTGGGYGNFSVFGLPGTSNNFTVNGEQENDPFLNLNNSGPTNLLLGQNDISSVSVITLAYEAEFGSFGGAQINEISRSGANKFHGDANYFWNGRTLNANNWFNKQSQAEGGAPNTRPFSNDNQWSASVGGPILRDKAFFFFNTEGLRFITAPADTVFTPSPAYQRYILGVSGNCTDGTGSLQQNGAAAECAFYQNVFNLFNAAPGINQAQLGSNDPNVGPVITDPAIALGADPTVANASVYESFVSTPKIFAKESLATARVDYVLGLKDSAFAHFKYDNGTQPSDVDPISSNFNAISYQPAYEGQLVETHTFSPNLVNQFLFTAAHYSALFQSANQTLQTATLPTTIVFGEGFFTTLGGAGYAFPQGRNATQIQFADDVSWTHKQHQVKAGYAFKKDYITNLDTGIYTNPLNVVLEAGSYYAGTGTEKDPYTQVGGDGDFEAGTSYYYRQSFPDNLSNPNSLYTEGFYVQDNYKVTPKLLVVAGIRIEHDSNPVCSHACFSRINQDVGAFLATPAAGSTATPYNSVISYGQTQAFQKFQKLIGEPRIEFTYSATPKLVVRGGYGMFTDTFPGQVADELLRNIPQDPRFQPMFALIDPTQPGSGAALAAQSAAVFKNGATTNFFNGGSYASIHAAAAGFVRPNIATAAPSVHYPTYQEFSLQMQYAVTPNTTVQVSYVGNHGYHEPNVATNSNAYNPYGSYSRTGLELCDDGVTTNLQCVGPAAGFVGLPSSRPAVSFGTLTNLQSNASSNFNGGIISVVHRSKYVTGQINYTRSHAMDQISNGGFLGFTGSSITGPLAPNSLQYNYGNADYDIRNSLNGNYLVNLPGYNRTALMKSLTGGFQVAGTVFYRSGFPFTVTDANVSNSFGGSYSGGVPAQIANVGISHSCSANAALNAGCFNTTTDFTDPAGFIAGQRNAFNGPHYFNTDMAVNKAFALPFENLKMIVGANFYNILNHPNFANPSSDISDIGTLGRTFSTVSVPTSIYGSGLGGDASIRVIQLHAKVSF